jgi:hypothetical protein
MAETGAIDAEAVHAAWVTCEFLDAVTGDRAGPHFMCAVSPWVLTCIACREVRVKFACPEHALYAAKTLQVDAELQTGKAFKDCTSEGNELVV